MNSEDVITRKEKLLSALGVYGLKRTNIRKFSKLV